MHFNDQFWPFLYLIVEKKTILHMNITIFLIILPLKEIYVSSDHCLFYPLCDANDTVLIASTLNAILL